MSRRSTYRSPGRQRFVAGPNQPLYIVGGFVIVLAFIGVMIWVDRDYDSSTLVPAPEPSDRAAVVTELARASAAQGVCYGWRLSSTPVSIGSNLGDGVPVENDARCPRWLKVTATVTYTPESSEASDSASFQITSSGLRGTPPDATELRRFGITEDTFIDDPGDAISRAVLALPLLAYEHGLALPVPPNRGSSSAASPSPAPSAAPSPEVVDAGDLADAGGDRWRGRGPALVFAGLSLVVAVGLVVWAGLRMRRPAPPPTVAPLTPRQRNRLTPTKVTPARTSQRKRR
jgi:hypothetical protein